MGAPIGNTYYLLRSTDGKEKKYKTLKALSEGCNAYFQYCMDNPIIRVDYRGKDNERVEIPIPRAFTWIGLANYLDVCEKTLWNYRKAGNGYLQLFSRVGQIIYAQKFENAAAGLLNPAIIARDLGLADTTKTRVGEIDESKETPPIFPDVEP